MPEWADPVWHLFVIRLLTKQLTIGRNAFIEALTERNIGTSVHYLPVHMHPFYRDKYALQPEACPVAKDAFERMLTLPLHPGLSDADVADVLEAVEGIVRANRR